MSVDRSEKILYGVEFEFDRAIQILEDYPNIPGYPHLEILGIDPMCSTRQFVFLKETYRRLDRNEVVVERIGNIIWPPSNNIDEFITEYNLKQIGEPDWYLICDYW